MFVFDLFEKKKQDSVVKNLIKEESWHAGDNAWSSEHDQWARESVEQKQLHVGDPVVVTAPNEFEGKTGEISEFSPSGKFVVVNLYNHGEHSMHLSDVEYNQYADEEDDIDEHIGKVKGGYRLYSKHGSKNLGTFPTKAGAEKHEREVQYFKHADESIAEDFSDSPVAGAITRRILMQRSDLLKQYGPELVGAAVDNVADYVGDVDEIGSSDVSAWVNEVERMLKENPPEAFSEQATDPQREKAGKIINRCFGKIYDYGDSGLEYLDRNAPVWYDLFSNDQYNGDIDTIIARAPIDLLVKSAQELMDVVSDLPYELEEGWSDAVVARRTGRPRTPYSVYIKGKKWKDFENDDHAEAVANKLRAKFQADGRDPSVITIAATDYDQGMAEGQLNELASGYASNKGYNELGAYKRYNTFVSKKKFNNMAFIAVAENPRTNDVKFKATGSTPEEAVEKLHVEIDKEIEVATKVSGAATIDFNVDFVRDILEMSTNTFYAKIVEGPRLVIAGKELENNPEIMQSQGFKRSSIRTVGDSENSTKLPAMPLSAKASVVAGLIANGRYVLKNETIDRDGNRVFDLEFDSQVADPRERIRMGTPAITIGTKREVAEVATDYSKRRAREKDVDAGKPVPKQRQPKMTDYQKRRAQQKKEMELGETTNYWTRLQDERNTKIANLVGELTESIKDIK